MVPNISKLELSFLWHILQVFKSGGVERMRIRRAYYGYDRLTAISNLVIAGGPVLVFANTHN